MTPPLWKKQRGTKQPLDENERGEGKAGLKLNIQKTKIMAAGPITSWQMSGWRGVEAMTYLLLGSKIIADGDCSHEIRSSCFLKGRL